MGRVSSGIEKVSPNILTNRTGVQKCYTTSVVPDVGWNLSRSIWRRNSGELHDNISTTYQIPFIPLFQNSDKMIELHRGSIGNMFVSQGVKSGLGI